MKIRNSKKYFDFQNTIDNDCKKEYKYNSLIIKIISKQTFSLQVHAQEGRNILLQIGYISIKKCALVWRVSVKAKIIGTGSFLPEKRLSNYELSTMVDTNDEWIVTRTGIRERRIADEVCVSDMALEAGLRAIDNAAVSPESLEMIIVATSTQDYYFPNCASRVQEKLGAQNAACVDISAACSGFIAALSMAQAYVEAGIYRRILVIGSEKMSDLVDWHDRSVCVLFGDGAGACVVSESDSENDLSGIVSSDIHNDGKSGKVLTARTSSCINMNGQEVFKFAVKKVPETIRYLLEKSETDINDIKYFILHQANVRIIESVAKRLESNMEKFPRNIENYGNTSSASIPILLDELNRQNKLCHGDLLILAGFGAGLSWGSILVRW